MAIQIRKAERRQAKMRVGITAPSGGGKTYSALLLAYGLCGDWNTVGLIDTENGSGELYAHLAAPDAYNVITLEAPFTPEKYIEAIRAFERAGMAVIVIDSATHEWDGPGGCLEIKDSMGGKYQDWAKVTPRHQAFISAIVQSGVHIVTTTRRKQDYEMTKEGNKVSVEKVGLKEVQRDGFEYELTLNFELDIRHNAIASKDRTGLFSGKPAFIITADTGRALREWCESGVPATAPAAVATSAALAAPAAQGDATVCVEDVTERAYKLHGQDAIGYVITLSDGRVARSTDAAIGNRAKSYRDSGLALIVSCEMQAGKLMVTEMAPADAAAGF